MAVKGLVAFLTVVAALLAVATYQQRTEAQAEKAQIADLRAKIADQEKMIASQDRRDKVVALELQARCAKQAQVEFEHEGLAHKTLADYQNHYNDELGKCFVLTQSTEVLYGHASNNKLLVDPFEGKIYGVYNWYNTEDKKYWEVAPSECSVIDRSGEKKVCKSADQFDDMAKMYMQ